MNFLRIAKDDIKGILKNRFIRVSIIAIIVVPLLYSLLYLYAFWDPYSKLEDIHIAVVNNDKGTVTDGDKVNYGQDVIDELKSNNEIGWEFTTEEEANDGLEGKTYYAKVVIPEDFSSNVISAKEGKPQKAKIDFITNDKKNFLASQINSKVETELRGKLNASVSSNYIEVAFDSLYETKDGFEQAADGSKKIYDGLNTLNGKVPELADGTNKLEDGSSQLVDGQIALNNGLGELNSKIPELSSGVKQVSDGSSRLKDVISAANSAAKQISDGSKKLNDSYNSTVYPSIEKLDAGANQLKTALSAGNEDIAKLNAGANSIAENSDAISAGYNDIYNGINTLVSGASDSAKANATVMNLLSQASTTEDVATKNALINKALQITQAVNEKAESSTTDVTKLVQGNNYFKEKLNEYTEGSKQVANGTNSLIANVSKVQGGVNELSAGLNQLSSAMNPKTGEFGVGLKTISDSNTALSKGLSEINEGASQLKVGANLLNSNIPSLSSGVSELYNGSNKLVDGQQELNTGIVKLNSSVPELTDGVTKLYDGSKELSTKLQEGADKLKDGLVNTSKDMGEFASQAIDMNLEAINAIPNYGTGFAPYFIPLSLWIGAIMMFFVIPSKLKDEETLSDFDRVTAKYLSYAFVGILQAVLVSIVVLLLGLKPTNVGLYFLTNIFLSLVFVAVVQCLISLFGDAGRLLAIILLILQLTACAGTFPLEVVPKFFKVLNPFMPFTYAVQALRETISADVISYSIIGKDFLILGLVLVIFLAVSILLKSFGEKLTSTIEGRKETVNNV